MTDLHQPVGRSSRLEHVLTSLLSTAPELEAAAVVSFDGLPMASALPAGMDEDRVAAMSAALLSLGDRAAQGLGRGDLSQVYVEGEHGTVFLVSADDEAVLVAVASRAAKIGLMLFEVRRAAQAVAAALVADDLEAGIDPYVPLTQQGAPAPSAEIGDDLRVQVPMHSVPAPAPAPAAPPAAAPAAPPAAVAVVTPMHAAQSYEAPSYEAPSYEAQNYAVPDYAVPDYVTDYPADYVSAEQPAVAYAEQSDYTNAQQSVQAVPQQIGGPVMVPVAPVATTIPDTLAPDGLAWPQLPATESGWA